MPSFAELIYGTAQDAAKSTGAGLAESIQSGASIGSRARELDQKAVNQAASLAMKQEELLQKKAELADKVKAAQQAKLDKLYDYIKEARNYDTAGARGRYLKSALGYRNALGLDPQAIPDEQILSLGMDENMNRFATLEGEVQSGRLTRTQALKIANDPQALAAVVPTPIDVTKVPDFDKAEKDFLDRQSRERAAALSAGQKVAAQAAQGTQELRKELTAHPVTKESFVINSNFDRIKSSLGGKPSAAGDMAGIFSYMKLLDPGSTVREGEFANAQNAAGVPEKVLNAYNNALNGQLLNPNQRKDFLNQASKIYNTQLERQKEVNKQYTDIAKEAGLKPSQVVVATDMRAPETAAKLYNVNGQSMSGAEVQAMAEGLPKGSKLRAKLEQMIKGGK